MEFKTKKYIFGSDTKYSLTLSILKETDDYLCLKVHIDFGGKIVPESVKIQWDMPCCDVFSHWDPLARFSRNIRPDWSPQKTPSRSAFGAPIKAHISLSGRNRSTVSVTDVQTPLEILSGIYEDNANIRFSLVLFTQRTSAISEYQTELIIDNRDISYHDTISDAVELWAKCGFASAPVPESAKMPMYSSWYSYHQKLDSDTLISELKLAKELGMETVIVDDGWQTDDNNRGYAYCGDWEVTESKIPDMKKLVDSVHSLGMKYMMWYSVPFVGKSTKAWKQFSDKFLNGTDRKWSILDPRYPDVRSFLVSIYTKAVSEWGLDGLKLDFIDSFNLSEYSNVPDNSMDCESLEDGIRALLREARAELVKIKPDILLEFRQNYMGPLMRTYGNMIRVSDCPNDALANRIGCIDLRLTSGSSAVHSDMLMWNYSESVEAAALQLISIMFSVPQISVLIEKLSAEHYHMLKFYLDFWIKNRACLLDGKLTAKNPEANYSLVFSETENEIIAVSYSRNILDVNKAYNRISFINGSWDSQLLINNQSAPYNSQVTVFDCMGNKVEEHNSVLISGYCEFDVPASGILEIINL